MYTYMYMYRCVHIHVHMLSITFSVEIFHVGHVYFQCYPMVCSGCRNNGHSLKVCARSEGYIHVPLVQYMLQHAPYTVHDDILYM